MTTRDQALLSDEAIRLASAFLTAGSPRLSGRPGAPRRARPELTESIHDNLLAGTQDARRAPFAVHRTVGRIREHYPGLPSLWAAYVHVGA